MNTPQARQGKYGEGPYVSSGCPSGKTAEESDDEYYRSEEPKQRQSFISALTTPEDSKVGPRSDLISMCEERNEMINKIFELEQRLLDSSDFIRPSEGDELHLVLLEMEEERNNILNKLKESKIILAMKSLVIADLSTSKKELENELNPLKMKYRDEITSLKRLLDHKSAEVDARIGECSGLLIANKAIGSKLSDIKRQLEVSEEGTRIANLQCKEHQIELKNLKNESNSTSEISKPDCLGSRFPEKDDKKEFLGDITTSIANYWDELFTPSIVAKIPDLKNDSKTHCVCSDDGKSNSSSDSALVHKLQIELQAVVQDLQIARNLLKNKEESLSVDNGNYKSLLEDVNRLNAEMAERSIKEDDLRLQLFDVQVELMSTADDLRTRTSELKRSTESLGQYNLRNCESSALNLESDKIKPKIVNDHSMYDDNQSSCVDNRSDTLSIKSGDTLLEAIKSAEYLQVETEIRSLASFLRSDGPLGGAGSNSRIITNFRRMSNRILDGVSEVTEAETESEVDVDADTDTIVGTDKEEVESGNKDVFQSLEEVEKFKIQILELEKKLIDANQLNTGRSKDKTKTILVIKALQSQRDFLMKELTALKLQLKEITENMSKKCPEKNVAAPDISLPFQSEVSILIKNLSDASIISKERTEVFVVNINEVKNAKLILDLKMDEKDENEYAIMLIEHYLQLKHIQCGKEKIIQNRKTNEKKIKRAEFLIQQSSEIIRTTNAQQKLREEMKYLDSHKKALKGFVKLKIEQETQLVELEKYLLSSNQKTKIINQNCNNKNNYNILNINFYEFNMNLKNMSELDLTSELVLKNNIKATLDIDITQFENNLRTAVERMKKEGEMVVDAESFTESQKKNLATLLAELNKELHTKTAELMAFKTTIEKNFIELQRNMRRRNSSVNGNLTTLNNVGTVNDKSNSSIYNGMHTANDHSNNKAINLNDILKTNNNNNNDNSDNNSIKNDHQITSIENEINELITYYRQDSRADTPFSTK